MAEEKQQLVEAPQGLVSPGWFTPMGRVRLVNGVWVADAPEQPPHSSSVRAGARRPRDMREKLAREAEEKAAEGKESPHH